MLPEFPCPWTVRTLLPKEKPMKQPTPIASIVRMTLRMTPLPKTFDNEIFKVRAASNRGTPSSLICLRQIRVNIILLRAAADFGRLPVIANFLKQSCFIIRLIYIVGVMMGDSGRNVERFGESNRWGTT
jgi:hypothetical protein